MTKKGLIILALAIVCNLCVFGQKSATYTSGLVDFQKALSLYNSQQYLAAQSLFDQIQDSTKDEVVKSDCA
jgi:hypothetical protein